MKLPDPYETADIIEEISARHTESVNLESRALAAAQARHNKVDEKLRTEAARILLALKKEFPELIWDEGKNRFILSGADGDYEFHGFWSDHHDLRGSFAGKAWRPGGCLVPPESQYCETKIYDLADFGEYLAARKEKEEKTKNKRAGQNKGWEARANLGGYTPKQSDEPPPQPPGVWPRDLKTEKPESLSSWKSFWEGIFEGLAGRIVL